MMGWLATTKLLWLMGARFVTKSFWGKWARHKIIMGKMGSSQNPFGGNGLVTKSFWGKWARHKIIMGKMGSSQNPFGGNGLVTKSLWGDWARHKILKGEMGSSQNHYGGNGLVTKSFWGARHKIILGQMGSSQNHFDQDGFVTKSFRSRCIRHKIISIKMDSSQKSFWEKSALHRIRFFDHLRPSPIHSSQNFNIPIVIVSSPFMPGTLKNRGMPPKGTKRKDSNGGNAGGKKGKKADPTLPSVAPDSLAMPHMREFEKWFLESKCMGPQVVKISMLCRCYQRSNSSRTWPEACIFGGTELRRCFAGEAWEQGPDSFDFLTS